MTQTYWIRQLVRAFGEGRIVVALPSRDKDGTGVSYVEAGAWRSIGPRFPVSWDAAPPVMDGAVPARTLAWLNDRLDQPFTAGAHAHPLEAWGFRAGFVLTDDSANNFSPPAAEGLAAALLNEQFYRIQSAFSVSKLNSLKNDLQLTQAFLEAFCQTFLPESYKSSAAGLWVPYCKPLFQGVSLEERELQLGQHAVFFKAALSDGMEAGWLKTQTEELFGAILEKWELCRRPEQLAAGRLDEILTEVKNSRQLLEAQQTSLETAWQNLGELRALSHRWSSPGASVDFEFYRGTESWSIRFEGELVKMANQYTMGLIYIHQLLLNPGTEISCHQLYLRSKNDLNQSAPLWRELSDTYGKNTHPDDEKSWLETIKRIEPHLRNAKPEAAVELQEYLVFAAEQLYRINSSQRNFNLMTDARRQLKVRKLELEPGQSDERFYKKGMTLSGVLYSGREDSRDNRKIYQNVTKAINRTIKTMSNTRIVEFFQKTLSVGQHNIYDPAKWDGEEPMWKLWAD
ncbi:MAG TPA: hypothetical protein PKB07_03555 [Flavilitoribacter sp.]|nr:hypothetical protein [Flavilitoribacter sp.]